MTNRTCESCKHKTTTFQFDKNWKVTARFCKKTKTWELADLDECDEYEPNLHDHNAAPKP